MYRSNRIRGMILPRRLVMKFLSVTLLCMATLILNGCNEGTSDRHLNSANAAELTMATGEAQDRSDFNRSKRDVPELSVKRPAVEPGEALDRPDFDRSNFKASAHSVARGDLLACRNLDANFNNLQPANSRELADALHGTWVNQNMRSVHGRPVDTDAIWLIDMKSERPASILIDRDNLGEHILNNLYGTPTKAEWSNTMASLREDERLMMSFVNCTIEFVDYYVKVSNDVLIDELARGTRVNMDSIDNLDDAWKALVNAEYFESFEIRTAPFSNATKTVSAKQGDNQRVAITPDMRVVSEREIMKGLYPGAEYYMPMTTGGLFHITLRDVPPSGGLNVAGVELFMDAEYRGVGIGLEPNEPMLGVEQGIFRREGNAFVAGGAGRSMDELWTTSACGDKHNLDALSQVSNPAGHEGHEHDMLVFDRLIIGAPM